MSTQIGQKIKEVFESSGLKPAHVASVLHSTVRNTYYDFERDSIGTDRLAAWSKALNYNFFKWLVEAEGIELPIVQEPSVQYKEKKRVKVSIIIELDDENQTKFMRREFVQRIHDALR